MMSDPKEEVKNFSFQLDEFYLDLQEDGSKISILDKEIIEQRPFPGLRPFKTSEFQLFKGRDGQAEELLKRLKKNHFLAVIGSSGTGKSSLVRAGLIPQLFGGYLQEAGNKWNIAICRPGKDPVENLAIALSSIKGHSKDKSSIYDNYDLIGPQLNSSIYGILEIDELLNTDKPKERKPNLLIIIDQFEELFRFDRKDLRKKNIENHFVNLLLKASLNASSSVYVIITMRSEFLGDCVKYRGLPEAINEGQYLVPQLTRNQVKEVIEGPINLAGKKISPGLVELLVNEIEESKLKENLDQLPILQHSLMRTYQQAMRDNPEAEIGYKHYKAIGEMEKALANHAEAKYNELGEGNNDSNLSKKQKIAKLIFQALTDASTDQKGGRRPTELKNIYAIAKSINADTREVDEVINYFRDIDTSFIMPPINPELLNTGLYPNLMMDISHESLMRNWERLNKWISEEVRFGRLYKILNERRELNEQDKSELVRGVLLKELIDWKANYSNNVTWASRYHQLPKGMHDASLHNDVYKKNLQFLAQSEAASEAAKEAEQRQLKEEIVRAQKDKSRKKLMNVFAAAAIISLCFGLWAFKERANATKSAVIARQQEKIAQKQTSLAIISEKDAREQEEAASISRGEAIKKQEEALLLAEQLKKQTAIALASEKAAREQKAIAENLRKETLGQNINLEKQLVKSEVQKENFYSSNFLSPSIKESLVKAVFKDSLVESKEISLSKYIDMEFLEDINKATEAREVILNQPVLGLRMADTVWKHIAGTHSNPVKNKLLETIFLDIFKKNAFPEQEIKPGSYTPLLIAVSKDYSHFAVDNLNAIAVGKYTKDSLKIEHRFTNQLFDDSVNDIYSKSVVIALSYKNDNKILSLQDNGKIIEWEKNKGKTEIASLPEINYATLARFSPDGKQVVTASKDEGIMNVWNLSDIKSGTVLPSFIDTTARNRNIKQIDFSPDGKRIIKLYNTGKMEVWNITEKTRLPGFNTYRIITAANFSPDSNYILTASADNYISIFDPQGKEINPFSLSYASKANTDYPFSRITYLSLDTSWKKLIIAQEGGEVFVAKRIDNDSVIRIVRNAKVRQPNSLIPKKLNGSTGGIKEAAFLTDDRVVTLNDNGFINLWDAESNFTSLNEEFAGVKKLIALTYVEKLESGQLSFEEIKNDTNKNNLRTAALYYYDGIYNEDKEKHRSNIDKTMFLYKKLSDVETGSFKRESINKIISLQKELNTLELNNAKPDYPSIIKRLNEVVDIEKSLKETDTANTALNHTLANDYNDLAFYSLFAGDFLGSIPYAKKGLEYEPSYNIIYTNLALAFLLSNQDKFADDMYKEYKDKIMTYDGRTFREGFLQDFGDFTKKGIISPNDKRVARIKKILELNN